MKRILSLFRRVPFAPALLAAFAALSCSQLTGLFASTEEVTVVLPAPHPAIVLRGAGNPTWTVRWYGREGELNEMAGISGQVVITLERGLFTPVFAIPETAGSGIPPGPFPRAGSLYPLGAMTDSGRVRVEASWPGGILALCAERTCVSAAGGFRTGRSIAERFNWNRLAGMISEIDDPLTLDFDRVAEAVLSGHMTVYDVKAFPLAAIAIPRPVRPISAGTTFIPAWPGGEEFCWPETGSPVRLLPDGLSRFFSPAGILSVQVTKGKSACAFFEPYILQDRGASGTVLVP